MSSHNMKIAKNTLYLTLRMVFVLFVSLYTSRVFLNVLGVVDYGISNVVAGFVSMFTFLNTSLSNAIQRFYNAELGKNNEDGVTNVYNTSLLIQAIISIVVLLLLETLGLWYIREKMVIPQERREVAFWLFQFSAFSAVIVILQAPFTAAVMAYERMNTYAIFSILDVILKLIFAFLLPYIILDKLLIYGLFYLCLHLLNFGLYYFYCKCNFVKLRYKRVYIKGLFKEMMTFSGWNLCDTFACMAREQGINIILNLFFGPIVNAARGVAYQVSGALQGFVANLSLAAKPQMVQSYAGGDELRTIKLMYTTSKINFISLFVLSIPIILNIDYILNIWLGNSVPDHAANFVILVIVTNFINNLNAPLSNVVYATGNMRNYELTFSIINLLILPISYILLKNGAPPEAAFFTYLSVTIFVQIGCLLVVRTLVSLSLSYYFFKLIVPLFLVAIIVYAIMFLINGLLPTTIWKILLEYGCVAVLSVAMFYCICLDKAEKDMLRLFVSGLLKK